MEKETSEGIGSLFLLLLAILAITICLNLSGATDTQLATTQEQTSFAPTAAAPAPAKNPVKQRLII